jgi:hypothetical protein
MTEIPEGYALIEGRSRANAQAALEAADRAGVDQARVRAVDEGYLVPVAVADAYADGDTTVAPQDNDTPDDGWKNADIVAWAEAHDVDLGGASKKADMLAAIAAADKEG